MEFYNIGISEYKQIINSIRLGYGFDFSYYSPITFRRKIINLMLFYGINNLDDLIFQIENKLLENDFFRFFHVPITELFRGPAFWRKLIDILQGKHLNQTVKLCFPGCVIGNEILSFLILIREIKVEKDFRIVVSNPFPMEIDTLVLKLEKRKFELSKINFTRLGLKGSDLNIYFNVDDKENLMFTHDNRNKIVFEKHDLFKSHLSEKQDMIFFRNQLLYFTIPNDKIVIENISQSLKPKGYLFIGEKERIDNPEKYRLRLIDNEEQIYQRI